MSAARWPDRPYKGFGNYGPQDRALFAGRETAIGDFAEMIADSSTRIIALHGPTGCGKSSFLRAGVIPFLESRKAGFTVPKDPEAPSIRPDARDAKAVFVRSTERPLEALADGVFRLAEAGYSFDSPMGREQVMFAAAKLGCATATEFVSRIAGAPLDLIEALERMVAAVPLKLVLVVDQAEEIVTQQPRRENNPHAENFFRFLDEFARRRWQLTLILSLRTEFFGVLHTRLRQYSSNRQAIDDFYLDELERRDIVEAIVRPTEAKQVPGLGTPREHYGFVYAPGLAERIADDLLAAVDVGGLVSGILPFLQVVCERLYQTTSQRAVSKPWTISPDDYSPGRVLETMAQYIDEVLDAFLRSRTGAVNLARSHWKDVLASLAKTQADGSVTTALRSVDEVRALALKVGATHFDDMIAYLASDDQSVLRRDRVPDPVTLQPVERISLRHDAIGLALRTWTTSREAYQQEMVVQAGIRTYMPSVDEIVSVLTFDEAGSGTHLRRWNGMRSTQKVVDFWLPYGFRVSPPGRIVVPEGGIVAPVEGSVLPVRFIEQALTEDRIQGTVELAGTLGPDTGFAGFEIRQGFERAFCMTRAEATAAYGEMQWTTEYATIFVQLPTKSLKMTVEFPLSFRSPRLEAGPVVFLGNGEKSHEAEIARIRERFRLNDGVATLDVEDPVQGLQYAIYWVPPN
jgi:Novel STAND NTPase 1